MAVTGKRRVSGISASSSCASLDAATKSNVPVEGTAAGNRTTGNVARKKHYPDSVTFRYVVRYFDPKGKLAGTLRAETAKHAKLFTELLDLGPEYGKVETARKDSTEKLTEAWYRTILWYENSDAQMRAKAVLWVETHQAAELLCFWWERHGRIEHPGVFYHGACAPYPSRAARPCSPNDDVPF